MKTTIALIAGTLAAAIPSAVTAAPVDASLLRGLEWRNIGPHRGGRVVAVAGVTSQP